MTSVRLSLLKGGSGSGHFDHEGRPGKVGGSAPGKGKGKVSKPKATTSNFAHQAKSGDYKGKGDGIIQGRQADTRKVEMADGTLAIEKKYSSRIKGMADNDVTVYEISKVVGIDGVPEIVKGRKDNMTIQEFIPNSVIWYDYEGRDELGSEVLNDAVMYDVLIGNMDRFAGNGNILFNEDTGSVSLIDNGFSLSAIPERTKSLGYKGFVKQKVKRAGWFIKGWSPVGNISKSTWNAFSAKARSDKVRSIIMNDYGSTKGKQIYKGMMGRLDAFEQLYESQLTNKEAKMAKLKVKVEKGGSGSGHFGHDGRPGKVGGSTSGAGGGKGGKKKVGTSKPKGGEGSGSREDYEHATRRGLTGREADRAALSRAAARGHRERMAIEHGHPEENKLSREEYNNKTKRPNKGTAKDGLILLSNAIASRVANTSEIKKLKYKKYKKGFRLEDKGGFFGNMTTSIGVDELKQFGFTPDTFRDYLTYHGATKIGRQPKKTHFVYMD